MSNKASPKPLTEFSWMFFFFISYSFVSSYLFFSYVILFPFQQLLNSQFLRNRL